MVWLSLTVFAAVRELLGSGALSTVAAALPGHGGMLPIAQSPIGALLLLGLVAAGIAALGTEPGPVRAAETAPGREGSPP